MDSADQSSNAYRPSEIDDQIDETALAEVMRGTLSDAAVTGRAWAVLAVWALAAPILASRLFRWE